MSLAFHWTCIPNVLYLVPFRVYASGLCHCRLMIYWPLILCYTFSKNYVSSLAFKRQHQCFTALNINEKPNKSMSLCKCSSSVTRRTFTKIRWFTLNLRKNNILTHILRITITFPVTCPAFDKVIKHDRDRVIKRKLFSSTVKISRIYSPDQLGLSTNVMTQLKFS